MRPSRLEITLPDLWTTLSRLSGQHYPEVWTILSSLLDVTYPDFWGLPAQTAGRYAPRHLGRMRPSRRGSGDSGK